MNFQAICMSIPGVLFTLLMCVLFRQLPLLAPHFYKINYKAVFVFFFFFLVPVGNISPGSQQIFLLVLIIYHSNKNQIKSHAATNEL